ncbi:MAG: hypothetical protein ACEPOV_02085 [Hyphomicrobiales bacterium]
MRKSLLIIVLSIITSFSYSQDCLKSKTDGDGKSIESLVKACLECISGKKGEKRDWKRFENLFLPTAQLSYVICKNDSAYTRVTQIDMFIDMNSAGYEKYDFFEKQLNMKVQKFGHLANVCQKYEKRSNAFEGKKRGYNFFQLVFERNRWWVLNLVWQSESDIHKVK